MQRVTVRTSVDGKLNGFSDGKEKRNSDGGGGGDDDHDDFARDWQTRKKSCDGGERSGTTGRRAASTCEVLGGVDGAQVRTARACHVVGGQDEQAERCRGARSDEDAVEEEV